MKTLLVAFAVLFAMPGTGQCQEPAKPRLSQRDWQSMFYRCTEPEYQQWMAGEITELQYYRWCDAVRQAMIKKYGQPLPPPPKLPSVNYRPEMEIIDAIDRNTEAIEWASGRWGNR